MSILTKIKKSLHNNLPFVAYRKPMDNKINCFIQRDNSLYCSSNLNASGFVFAPFNYTNDNAVVIPADKSYFYKEVFCIDNIPKVNYNDAADLSSRQSYIDLVKKAIKDINKGCFTKVVLSRKELVQHSVLNWAQVFKKLLSAYPNAMAYIWHHPKIGLWLGATPEILVKIKYNKFETTALAGTLPYLENVSAQWTLKEIDEQKIVSNFIVEKLKPLCSYISIGKAQTLRAGNLVHLNTKIKGVVKGRANELIKILHPTPAVCGMPVKEAKDFIFFNEAYKRTFYTGFLGELNFDNNDCEIFVNLRCMEVKNNKAFIYIGGGITKDSVPENEWEETVAKAMIIKKML
ncbi:MAG: chorismate-binding protein [Tenacibaculum sp.]